MEKGSPHEDLWWSFCRKKSISVGKTGKTHKIPETHIKQTISEKIRDRKELTPKLLYITFTLNGKIPKTLPLSLWRRQRWWVLFINVVEIMASNNMKKKRKLWRLERKRKLNA
jgi:hypothetical protein